MAELWQCLVQLLNDRPHPRLAGSYKFFCEKLSSVAERQQLNECLRFIRKGDTLVVTKLDRLARSMRDLIDIVDQVKEKGAELRILAMNLDTSNATGELMLNVLGSVAQFERSMMLERQREGIAKAKAEGKFKGRAPTAQRRSRPRSSRRSMSACQASIGSYAANRREELSIGRTRISVWRRFRRIAPIADCTGQERE